MNQEEGILHPINRIAEKLGLSDEDLELYGRYTAKIRLSRLPDLNAPPEGKLVLVTAITPTSHGEGKTVLSIGLAQAMEKLGKKAIVTLREPSLGPVFGVKGGATGGGRSQVLPSEKINLHFNGDIQAVAAAHNLLAAMIDSHLHHGNELRIDVDNIFWSPPRQRGRIHRRRRRQHAAHARPVKDASSRAHERGQGREDHRIELRSSLPAAAGAPGQGG
jgi:formate--tetrahydrofolate ligase